MAVRISGASLSDSKSPSGPMPMVANRARSSCSSGRRGRELEREVEDLEELRRGPLLLRCQRRHEVDRRGRRRRGLVQVHRQRRGLVAGLDLLDLVDVGGPQQLGAVQHEREIGVGPDDLVDTLRLFALPIRPRQKVFPAAVAGGAAADVGHVVRVEVDELQRVVAVLLDRRDGQDQRFGAQVGAEGRVRRVRVRCLDRLVLGCVQPCGVVDLVPSALVLGVVLVDEVRVHDPVVVDDRKAVDVGLFRDRTRLLGRHGSGARRWRRRRRLLVPVGAARRQQCENGHEDADPAHQFFSSASVRTLIDRPAAATSASIFGNSSGTDFSSIDSPTGVDNSGLSHRIRPTKLGQLI